MFRKTFVNFFLFSGVLHSHDVARVFVKEGSSLLKIGEYFGNENFEHKYVQLWHDLTPGTTEIQILIYFYNGPNEFWKIDDIFVCGKKP